MEKTSLILTLVLIFTGFFSPFSKLFQGRNLHTVKPFKGVRRALEGEKDGKRKVGFPKNTKLFGINSHFGVSFKFLYPFFCHSQPAFRFVRKSCDSFKAVGMWAAEGEHGGL